MIKKRIKFILHDSVLFLVVGLLGYLIIAVIKVFTQSDHHMKILENIHFIWLVLVVIVFLVDSLIRLLLITYRDLYADYPEELSKFSKAVKKKKNENMSKDEDFSRTTPISIELNKEKDKDLIN